MSQAAYRAAAVTFLTDYANSAGVKMQIYPGRPRSLVPPTGFVDTIREAIKFVGVTLYQRTPQVDVIVVFGVFDSADTVAQKDAFVDGLIVWAATRPSQAGANTTIAVVATEDLPAYVDDWVTPKEAQRTRYATLITLEGFSED